LLVVKEAVSISGELCLGAQLPHCAVAGLGVLQLLLFKSSLLL